MSGADCRPAPTIRQAPASAFDNIRTSVPLTSGSRLGPYDVTAQIGEGGMGAVYRARDTKLQRDVALKVLLPEVANDPERLARFRREAQTLAALNHPHIGAIYGLEESAPSSGAGPSGTIALVLELVEGPTLADRIARGPIPVDEALPIARQIAEALEAAHEQGIIHRDLKPANIKVRDDGTVKVLDFGLAKALETGTGTRESGYELANSPTFTSPAMTQAGLILGTAAYMAPEQAKGRPVDRRADIWAFGVVLYEMFTGRRAFTGNDAGDLLVSVLRDTPDLSMLPPATPASVRRLLRRCFEKDPRKRLSAMGDARLELDEVEAEPAAVVAGSASHRSAVFAAAAALTLAAIAAFAAWYLKPSATLPFRVLELPGTVAASNEVALSPDGARVAYILDGHLRVRALDAVSEQDLGPIMTSTEPAAARFPSPVFWSPDSKTIGFAAEGEVRTVPAAGGPVFAVARIPATGDAIAARWFHDGAIVFAVWRESVYSVPAAGGSPTVALALDPAAEIDAHHLSEGPDGSLIARVHLRSPDRYVTVLTPRGPGAGATRVPLTDDQTIGDITYVEPGFVVFDRQKTNAGVWVAPFTGGPIDVAGASLLQAGATDADVATDGSAIFVMPATSRVTPVWVDRTGGVSGAIGNPVSWSRMGFAVSPDGGRVAVVTGEDSKTTSLSGTMLIVRDLGTGTDTRLTARAARGPEAPSPPSLNAPSWFPSGDRLLVSAGGTEAGHLVAQRADEATAPREYAANFAFGRLSRDGRTLAAVRDDRGRHFLMSAPVSADGVVGDARRVRPDDDALVGDMDVSPDGRLVVYEVRRASGGINVFLSELPAGGGQWEVAEDATWPRFSPDGREVFYLESTAGPGGQVERRLMSRTINTTPSVRLGPATALFGGEAAAMFGENGYDVGPDGRRFLTMKSVAPGPGEGRRFIWMQNWPAVMKKSAPPR